jgi:ribosomal RNA-processing protein 12
VQTHRVLNAVEDTLRDQKTNFTPTAYFAALLALLGQYVSGKEIVNKDVATAVVYLLDLITPHVPAPLLRSKFPQILQKLVVVLVNSEADAPLVKPSLGCLESLLLVQDAPAWNLPVAESSPRRAVVLILALASDHRPKVRRRAQDALANVLKNPPPSPALDHPAAEMCAETALRKLNEALDSTKKQSSKKSNHNLNQNSPGLHHTLQLIKVVASSSGGWPSRKIDSLVETLLEVSRSSNEYVVMASFEVFEVIFESMASDPIRSAKLPHLLEILEGLQPSEKDSQLLPPWIAVLSRACDVYSQISPNECFEKLPFAFDKVSLFLSSMSNNIRVSAADCLISFLVNCVPASILIEPSIYDEKVFEKLAKTAIGLLSVKYQTAWMDVFRVLGAMFDSFHWRSGPLLTPVVRTIGGLRGDDSFGGKKEADAVLGRAVHAMGPEAVLNILPLNLATKDGPGRVWLLPIIRDAVSNTELGHFKSDMIPLSEKLYQTVLAHGSAEKTMEIKIFETVVHQIWTTLPGYCDLPIDLASVSMRYVQWTMLIIVGFRPTVCGASCRRVVPKS